MASLLNFTETPNLLELAETYRNDLTAIWGLSDRLPGSLIDLALCADEGGDTEIQSVCADEGPDPQLGIRMTRA